MRISDWSSDVCSSDLWNDEVVAESRKKLDRLYGALRELADVEPAPGVTAPDAFIAALEDDINTPMALAELFELARAANKAHDAHDQARIKAQMLDSGELLGLLPIGRASCGDRGCQDG